MTDKRRLIELLPAYHQTDTLKKFFGATVDNLFQPGSGEAISGYIGRVPTYANPLSDFSVAETTPERTSYQLEPAMVSYDTAGNLAFSLTYPDLIGYLYGTGANISDPMRLFEAEHYAWCPPIDVDKFINYHEYYWFGDAPLSELPIVNIVAPIAVYTGNGVTRRFAIPAANTQSNAAVQPCVVVNGVIVAASIVGSVATVAVAPPAGASVYVCPYTDLAPALVGQSAFAFAGFGPTTLAGASSNMLVRLIDGQWLAARSGQSNFNYQDHDSGSERVYFVDGVGQSIGLLPLAGMQDGIEVHYTSVSRLSVDGNEWSARNFWLHSANISFSGNTYTARQAVRPIIEFVAGIELIAGQTWSPTTAPLFALYDMRGNNLSDSSAFPGTNFIGSRIFGYQIATSGTPDLYLGHPLTYDTNGYIVFNNDIGSIRYSDQNGPITGLYQYAVDTAAGFTLSSVWHPAAMPLQQVPLLDSAGAAIIGSYGTPLYSVPQGLAANPGALDVGAISRSDWTAHFNSIVSNQVGFSGTLYADNTSRDSLRDLSVGTEIVQHRAPMLRTMLLAANAEFDMLASIRYADQQYDAFRHRLLQRATVLINKGAIVPTATPAQIMAATLADLKTSQTNNTAFWRSTMAVPSAEQASQSYFIPPTPASMGIMPLAVPALTVDPSFPIQISVIRGHDGSMTPTFGDHRDDILLAYEQAVYANISSAFDQDPDARLVFDLQSYVGGRFFTPTYGYTFEDAEAIAAPLFERWAQVNRIDYRTNQTYDSDNPFTWNFRGAYDRYGSVIAGGNWRSIYRWYFDTATPHTTPWEMLGFAQEPAWWSAHYGEAPYLRSNTTLWTDLQTGTIRSGSRAGVDPRYVRPDLPKIIPVDQTGALLDPIAAQIVLVAPSRYQAQYDWQAGDHGPAENFWHRSPSYGYACAQIGYMLKPVRFTELAWNTDFTGTLNDQWVDLRPAYYGARPLNSTVLVHGELQTDGTALSANGIQQWIADYLLSGGKSPSLLGNAVRGLDVRLIHQVGGYIAADALQATTDAFGLIPSEDVQITLYTSPPALQPVYSGVIVQQAGSGWSVIGYDARNPAFTIIPPDTSSPTGVISLAGAPEPTIYPWRSNTYYAIGVIVDYLGSTYTALTSHTSTINFEERYWNPTPGLAQQSRRVVTYLRGLATTQSIPYGTILPTIQDVANFLLGWQRYLVQQGWVFDQTDDQSGLPLDWSASVSSFLGWSQVAWSEGNFIALSPGAQSLHFHADTGTILNVENNTTGFFGLLDRSGLPIRASQVNVSRLDGDVTLSARQADIFAARVQVYTVEHAVIFSNITIFADTIYLPLFNMRQNRIKLNGTRTTGWAGRLDAPGYVIGTTGTLLPNFEKTPEDIRLMFDIESADRDDLRAYARHLTGYQARSYLQNLLLSDIEQFEFYQGMVQQKGAPGIFDKLLRSQRTTNGTPIEFLEEWAIRVSRFGAPLDPRVTLQLKQIEVRVDPQFVRFTPTAGAPLTWIELAAQDSRWLDRPAANTPFFPVHRAGAASVVPTAGPVRTQDVNFTLLNTDALADLYLNNYIGVGVLTFAAGTRMWVYQGPQQSYDVLEVFNLGQTLNSVASVMTYLEDSTLLTGTRIIMANPHGLTASDVGATIIVDGSSASAPELQGPQIIQSIDPTNPNAFTVGILGTQGYDFVLDGGDQPPVFILRSVRFADRPTLAASQIGFTNGDMAWIDNEASTPGLWSVVQMVNSSWVIIRNQPQRIDPATIVEAMVYNTATTISNSQLFADQPVISSLTVIDPLSGLFAGQSASQIDYQTTYDPARYLPGVDGIGDYLNYGDNPWGADHVGRVWWDLSTVLFIDPYTDQIGITPERDLAEISYRTANWATVAPGTSVDVYEWIASSVDPTTYALNSQSDTTGLYSGTVYQSDSPSFAQQTVFNPALNYNVTTYYFWVKNCINAANVSFRKTTTGTIALGLTSPTALGLEWIAPVLTDGLIVSGTAPYLNDTSTVLKIETRYPSTNEGHAEWVLIRQGDENSLPPEWLWRKLADSLGAFDATLAPLPSPSLALTRRTGLFDGQSMFDIAYPVGGDNRIGLAAARESFIGAVNAIFAATPAAIDRVQNLASIQQRTPVTNPLIWSRLSGYMDTVLPPAVEFSYRVYTPAQRNALLASPAFQAAIIAGTPLRVLLDNLNSDTPQWSIWVLDPSAALAVMRAAPSGQQMQALVAAADTVYQLGVAYDAAVSTLAERDALVGTLAIGARVLVDPHLIDANSSLFWAIYLYDPSNPTAVGGFVLHQVQTYDMTDFWSYTDWYASGYSAAKQPMTTYATAAARDAVEGSSPSHQFVALSSSIDGGWVWTAYNPQTLGWDVVAIQNGTIQFSANLYNASRTVQDLVLPSLSGSLLRDGAREIRLLAHSLFYSGLMIPAEINTLFFSILHFIHVQQDEVDWAFKTSLMTIAGYNVPLLQTPVQTPDLTGDFLSYISEVKPYHVKVREFTVQYSLSLATQIIHATDFDKPTYFDARLNRTRSLNPSIAADRAILSAVTTPDSPNPYYDWYSNCSAFSGGPTSYAIANDGISYSYTPNPNLIRNFQIGLSFDRVGALPSGFDIERFAERGFDTGEDYTGTAADRITRYYQPSTGMPALDLSVLMQLDFKGTKVDGFILNNIQGYADGLVSDFDWPINGFDTMPFDSAQPDPTVVAYDGANPPGAAPNVAINPDIAGKEGGYQLADPFVSPDRPEERAVVALDDGLIVRITSKATPGAVDQTARVYDTSNVETPTATFYHGALSQSANGVFVYRDGVATTPADYRIDHLGRTVTVNLTTTPSGQTTTVLIQVVGVGGIADVDGVLRPTTLSPIRERHLLVSDGSQTLALLAPATDTQVECTIDGLTIDTTAYHMVGTNVVFLIPPTVGSDIVITVREYGRATACTCNRQQLTYGSSQTWSLSARDTDTFPEYAGTFVEVNGLRLMPPLTYFGNFLSVGDTIPLDAPLSASDPLAIYIDGVLYPNSVPVLPSGASTAGLFSANDVSAQFVVVGSTVISANPNFRATDVVVVIRKWHDYDVVNGVVTILKTLAPTDTIMATTFSNAGLLDIVTTTPMAAANGKYAISAPFASAYSWVNMNGLRLAPDHDYTFSRTRGGHAGTSAMVALDNTNQEASIHVPASAGANTRLIVTTFNALPLRESMGWLVASRTPAALRMLPKGKVGNRSSWTMKHAWERIRIPAQTVAALTTALNPGDATIQASLTAGLSPKLVSQTLYAVPDLAKQQPGVVWIGAERIEYGTIQVLPSGQYVFGSLRRATQGTIAFPHAAGTGVVNGSRPFPQDVPVGPAAGDRESQPIHTIIAG